jgi:hypothetical protein
VIREGYRSLELTRSFGLRRTTTMSTFDNTRPCGCSVSDWQSGSCRFTVYSAENAKYLETRNREKRRDAWQLNRRVSSARSRAPPGQNHYYDEYKETALPNEFDEHYKCDNCQQNHIEEDCPKYKNRVSPLAPVVKGKQRMGHIDTKQEAIENQKRAVIEKNDALALEDERLRSGWKFCDCCCYLIPPERFDETTACHPGHVADIGEPHESYRYAVYGYTCCEKPDGAPGCCTHTHHFVE